MRVAAGARTWSLICPPSRQRCFDGFSISRSTAGPYVEARDALQRYLALPSTGPLKTIATWTAHQMSVVPQQGGGDPRYLETNERMYDGLRKAGMPEE
jgi:hypothetical protein